MCYLRPRFDYCCATGEWQDGRKVREIVRVSGADVGLLRTVLVHPVSRWFERKQSELCPVGPGQMAQCLGALAPLQRTHA